MKNFTLKDVFFNKFSICMIFSIVLLSNCYLGFCSSIESIIKYSNLILAIILIFVYIIDKKKNWFITTLLIFCFFIMVSCILGNYSNIKIFFGVYSSIITMCIYLNLAIEYKCKESLKILNFIFYILILINFFTIIFFPKGMYKTSLYSTNWFFKYDNIHIYMYFPALLVGYVNLELQNKKNFFKIMFYLEILCILFGVIYCHSATTIVSFSVLLLYLIFRNKINSSIFFNAKNYLIMYFSIFFGIVVCRLQNLFSWFIVGVLKKDLTFTTRTILWDRIIEYIKAKPVMGYGIENTEIFRKKMNGNFFTHAHNTIYDILYKGGMLALISHFALLIEAIHSLYKNKNSSLAKIASIFILGVLITMNFEAREEKMGLYIILCICFNIGKIIKLNINAKGEKNG